MQAISLFPSGNQSMHKAIHCDCNIFNPWFCSMRTAWPLDTLSQRSFSIQEDPLWGNANASYKLMSAQTSRQRTGSQSCEVLPQSTTTTRMSKHAELCYSLTILPPAPLYTHLEAAFFFPSLWSGGNSEWGGMTASTKHRRGKPPSCLIDFVFSG